MKVTGIKQILFILVLAAIFLPPNTIGADELDAWSFQQPGSMLQDCIFAGGKYVVVGNLGTVMHSSDGTNWVLHQIGPKLHFFGIAFGYNTYVAVGGEEVLAGGRGIIYTSTDLEHWTNVLRSASTFFGATFGDGEFVATGLQSTTMTSTDGIHWAFLPGLGGLEGMYGATHGNGKLVVVGGEVARVATFKNSKLIKDQLLPDGAKLRRVIYVNGKFIAVGGSLSSNVFTSEDGINWKKQKVSGTYGTLSSIAYGGGKFVAIGLGRPLISSLDGTNWTVHLTQIQPGHNLSGICFGNERFLAVGDGPVIIQSAVVGSSPR